MHHMCICTTCDSVQCLLLLVATFTLDPLKSLLKIWVGGASPSAAVANSVGSLAVLLDTLLPSYIVQNDNSSEIANKLINTLLQVLPRPRQRRPTARAAWRCCWRRCLAASS